MLEFSLHTSLRNGAIARFEEKIASFLENLVILPLKHG
jgi:hypothetical protein